MTPVFPLKGRATLPHYLSLLQVVDHYSHSLELLRCELYVCYGIKLVVIRIPNLCQLLLYCVRRDSLIIGNFAT
jgi:hypothetical protein